MLDSLYNKVEGLRPEHLRGYFWGLTGSLETVNSSFKKNLKLMVKFKEVMALGSLKITFFFSISEKSQGNARGGVLL